MPVTVAGRKFIFGRADEARDEQVARVVVELERRADLLDDAALQHDDLVGQRHRLDLVVGDVDHGRVELVVQPRELDPHLHAQGGVEVGQRLVEQEHLGLAHDGAADGDALALAARQLLGLAVQQLVELQDAAASSTLASRSLLRHAGQAQREAHVVRAPSCAGRARRTGTPWRGRARRAARR